MVEAAHRRGIALIGVVNPLVAAIREQDWGEKVLCVRINAWDTEWTTFDVIEVVGNAGERLEEVMLPKVQTAAEVVALDLLLTQVEKKAGLPIGHEYGVAPGQHQCVDTV